VATAGGDYAQLAVNSILNARNDIVRTGRERYIVGTALEPLVEALVDDSAIPGIVGHDSL
jgi:hypothetical protein